MKISIDTREDSHHEIRRVIQLLQQIVGNSSESSVFDSPSDDASDYSDPPQAASGIFNMFGDTQKSDSDQNQDVFSPAPDEEKKEEKDSIDIPEIVPY